MQASGRENSEPLGVKRRAMRGKGQERVVGDESMLSSLVSEASYTREVYTRL